MDCPIRCYECGEFYYGRTGTCSACTQTLAIKSQTKEFRRYQESIQNQNSELMQSNKALIAEQQKTQQLLQEQRITVEMAAEAGRHDVKNMTINLDWRFDQINVSVGKRFETNMLQNAYENAARTYAFQKLSSSFLDDKTKAYWYYHAGKNGWNTSCFTDLTLDGRFVHTRQEVVSSFQEVVLNDGKMCVKYEMHNGCKYTGDYSRGIAEYEASKNTAELIESRRAQIVGKRRSEIMQQVSLVTLAILSICLILFASWWVFDKIPVQEITLWIKENSYVWFFAVGAVIAMIINLTVADSDELGEKIARVIVYSIFGFPVAYVGYYMAIVGMAIA